MTHAREERRTFPRFGLQVDVSVKKKRESRTRMLLSKNISQVGVCLIVYEEFQIGEILQLDIFLPGQADPVVVNGRVIWVKEFVIGGTHHGKRFDIGLQFVDTDEKQLAAIQQYLLTVRK